MTIIKEHQLQILLNEFELISKNTITQCLLLKDLFGDPTQQKLIEEAEQNEILIDRLEKKIRGEVAFTIFMFGPVAEDLRRIISYQDITSNLERVGDMVLNIIRYLMETNLHTPELLEIHRLLEDMLDAVTLMLRNSILSFSTKDIDTAREVLTSDDEVDALYRKVREMVVTTFSGTKNSRSDVVGLINIEAIAHNLERCGDSATNIAESTIYLINGEDIRHEY